MLVSSTISVDMLAGEGAHQVMEPVADLVHLVAAGCLEQLSVDQALDQRLGSGPQSIG